MPVSVTAIWWWTLRLLLDIGRRNGMDYSLETA